MAPPFASSIVRGMGLGESPKLRSQRTTLGLWLCVAVAYLGWIAVALLVMLQLASGYGSSFLGIGPPPNTAQFRLAVGLVAALAYCVSSVGGVIALLRGDRAMRWAVAIPATLSALALFSVVIGKLT